MITYSKLPCRFTAAQLFLLHGFHNLLLELCCISLVRYSLWHNEIPHFLVQVFYHTCLTNGVRFSKQAGCFILQQSREFSPQNAVPCPKPCCAWIPGADHSAFSLIRPITLLQSSRPSGAQRFYTITSPGSNTKEYKDQFGKNFVHAGSTDGGSLRCFLYESPQ